MSKLIGKIVAHIIIFPTISKQLKITMLTLDLMNPEQRCIIMMIKHRLIELNKYYIYRELF